MAIYIIIGLAVIVLLWIAFTYNKLILLRNRVRNSWSQVDVVMKNRFDLIPNLLEAVKGYAAYESSTLNQLTELRTRYASAESVQDKVDAGAQLSGLLRQLMVNFENYADLRASENFLYLKEQLSEVEDKIRYARQFYNDAVERYNTATMSFPANLLAGWFDFKAEAFFHIGEADKALPHVKF
jgi:LemA protein